MGRGGGELIGFMLPTGGMGPMGGPTGAIGG